eukprot:2181032-Amphidinium_carterae.1
MRNTSCSNHLKALKAEGSESLDVNVCASFLSYVAQEAPIRTMFKSLGHGQKAVPIEGQPESEAIQNTTGIKHVAHSLASDKRPATQLATTQH